MVQDPFYFGTMKTITVFCLVVLSPSKEAERTQDWQMAYIVGADKVDNLCFAERYCYVRSWIHSRNTSMNGSKHTNERIPWSCKIGISTGCEERKIKGGHNGNIRNLYFQTRWYIFIKFLYDWPNWQYLWNPFGWLFL